MRRAGQRPVATEAARAHESVMRSRALPRQ